MDPAVGKRIVALRPRIIAHFDVGNWEEVGVLTGLWETIEEHPRLLRSLSWKDSDYSGHVIPVLREMAGHDPGALDVIEEYLDERFPGETHYVSARPSERKITFAPSVFRVPEGGVAADLVAAMMPFRQEFNAVYATYRGLAKRRGTVACARTAFERTARSSKTSSTSCSGRGSSWWTSPARTPT